MLDLDDKYVETFFLEYIRMSDQDKLLNFNEKRIENIEKKRRNFERILFSNFLGAYSVIDQAGVVLPIDLIDVSRDGLSFSVPAEINTSSFSQGTEITLRMYFTQDSYIPVVAAVKWVKNNKSPDGRACKEFGCSFDKNVPTFEALESFIEFLYKFAEHSSVDRGDAKVFSL